VEANGWRFPGVGEFQCYDRRALASLAQAAAEVGHPEWGYAGPHDSGTYNSRPYETGFFAPGGSYESGEACSPAPGTWRVQQVLSHITLAVGSKCMTCTANTHRD
jgi:hypothetical protein